jgi:predicted O-linked N-acetylglucosamine transferase (SPINDLY family)
VVRAFDAFIDVSGQSDADTARLLHGMEIDIAVDLMGFTRAQRLNIFAHRFAPIQVAYLGFPATTGAPYIDYLLADDFVIPPQSQPHYSEAVVYLPECYQANDDRRLIADPGPTRAEAGLPGDAFIYCSFNNSYKVTPEVFDVWCRLLVAKPDSVLWLLADTEATQHNLRAAASSRGVDPQRLCFAGRLAYPYHLARLRLADLFLDSFPFNAGTTASDALWAGLPVLTCCGQAFASRMAGSLLRAVGLPELACADLGSYEEMALRLAANPQELSSLRAKLAANRTTHPLFNTARFTRHLEAAYTGMYERFRNGDAPAHFAVTPLPDSACSGTVP